MESGIEDTFFTFAFRLFTFSFASDMLPPRQSQEEALMRIRRYQALM
jgi:hypothetical protein